MIFMNFSEFGTNSFYLYREKYFFSEMRPSLYWERIYLTLKYLCWILRIEIVVTYIFCFDSSINISLQHFKRWVEPVNILIERRYMLEQRVVFIWMIHQNCFNYLILQFSFKFLHANFSFLIPRILILRG